MRRINIMEHLRTLRHLTRSRVQLRDLAGKVTAHNASLNAVMAESKALAGQTSTLRGEATALAGENRALQKDVSELRGLQRDVSELKDFVKDLQETARTDHERLEESLARMTREVIRLNGIIDAQRRSYADMTRQLTHVRNEEGEAGVGKFDLKKDPFLDIFYREFEDRYRGSREEILLRLREYVGHIAFLKDRKKPRIVDLGCGRGEWLEVLRDEGLDAVGIDLNEAQVEAARSLGLQIEIDDAIGWLSRQKNRSVDFISAFHLIEHLEFEVLVRLFKEALRVLKPGGGLLIETPNPESLIVGAYKFWFDPTHVRPYPPELISQLLKSLTFKEIELLRLHPDGRNLEYRELYGLASPIADLIAGPLDYAILCRRS